MLFLWNKQLSLSPPYHSLSLFLSPSLRTCAVPLLHVEGEAAAAATLEAADGVAAGSVGAQAAEHLTLIHIYGGTTQRTNING